MATLRRTSARPAAPVDPDAVLVAWARLNPQAFTALYDRYFEAVRGKLPAYEHWLTPIG